MDHSIPAAKPYHDYRRFLTERYGKPLYRIPVDLGFGCPNRSPNGEGGCAFCGEQGARAVHLRPDMDLKTQVQAGVELARKRYKADGFMAYCQAFTSTHAPVDVLRERLEQLFTIQSFQAMILSTRPDCLPEETVSLLAEFTRKSDVWVEVGVQTANDSTLRQIKRGHDFACSVRAIEMLHEHGVKTAAHVILGLPGETSKDFRRTARELAQLPLDGIKIHNLHVVADTPLAECWNAGEFTAWDEHEYAEVLMDFLRRIPANWPVMRLVSDTPADRLVAPRWWLTKPQFLDYLERQMRERNWVQGDLFESGRANRRVTIVESSDGSDVPASALTETLQFDAAPPPSPPPPAFRLWPLLAKLRGAAEAVRNRSGNPDPPPLISKDELRERLSAGSVTVLDVGFGVDGHALQLLDAVVPGNQGELNIIALGLSPSVVSELKSRFPKRRGMLECLSLRGHASFPGGKITVFWGDPRLQIGRMRGKVHVVILEPSGVEQHVQLYTIDFLRRVARFLTSHGVIVSPATAKAFRRALQRIGMHVGACYPGRIGRGGTRASRHDYMVTHDLPNKERRILSRSVSAVPFRDPNFRGSKNSILRHREHVMARLRKRGWQKWVK